VNYSTFLVSSKVELAQLLQSIVVKRSIKFNLKLEVTYNIPHTVKLSKNRAFKTSTKTIFINTDFNKIVEKDLAILLADEGKYQGKCSG